MSAWEAFWLGFWSTFGVLSALGWFVGIVIVLRRVSDRLSGGEG